MNSIAASWFDSPWAILILVLVGVLFNWLMKRRRPAGADASPDDVESLPWPGEQGHSSRQLDWPDAWRQLLGGEPPPPLPPPIPRASRNEPTSLVGGRDEEPLYPDRRWRDEPPETFEGLRQSENYSVERSRQYIASASVGAAPVETNERQEKTIRYIAPFHPPPRPPARTVSTAHGRHSNLGGRAVHPWREPRVVRRAFIASLVFAPPKGLEP